MTPHRTHDRPTPAPALPLAALLLVLALAACGPMAAGDAARVDYRAGATYTVPAGSTLFVADAVPAGETGLTGGVVNRARLTWIPMGIGGESANAAGIVALADSEVAEDWEVHLRSARLVRERELGDRDGSYAYRLEVELRIEVPASAYDLTRRVRAELQVEEGETLRYDLLVRAE